MSNKSDTKTKFARNTFMLYGRSFLSMLIGIYSSRVIIECLGVVDYGIYNLVGGIVGALSFLIGTLRQTTQRYITFELGKKSDSSIVNTVFSMSMNTHILLSVLLTGILEVVGTILLFNYLDIPAERISIAFWVFQLSIVTMVINIISAPYIGMIVAHEDLGSFAYIDLLFSLLKLLAAYCVIFLKADHLLCYSLLLVLSSLFVRVLYQKICVRKYGDITKYRRVWQKDIFLSMIGFSFWTTLSALTSTFRRQGTSVVYNMFYGIMINPALALANQVNSSVLGFVMNFGSVFMPRITKEYAAKNYELVFKLMRFNAKMSYVVVLMFAVPLIVESDYILALWLKTVPPYTNVVMSLILVQDMMLNLSSGVNAAVRAKGKIKGYELTNNIVSITGIILFVLSFLVSNKYYVPLLIMIIMQFIVSLILVYNGHRLLGYSMKKYINSVYVRMAMVSIMSFVVPVFIFNIMEESFFRLFLNLSITAFSVPALLYFVGFDKKEKQLCVEFINKIISKCHKRKV